MMASNVILSDAEEKTNVELLLQKISYHLITFDPDSFEDQVKVEESEVKDFYTANPSFFMSEPESDGLLAFAAYTEKKSEVSEDQLKDYYELRKAVYVKDDGTDMTFDEAKDAIRKELEVTVDREEAETQMRAFNKAFRAALKADKEEDVQADPQKRFREEAEKAGLRISEVPIIKFFAPLSSKKVDVLHPLPASVADGPKRYLPSSVKIGLVRIPSLERR